MLLCKVQNTLLCILFRVISSPFIVSVAELSDKNALGTKTVTHMGEQDEVWIIVPEAEWKANPFTHHHQRWPKLPYV